jgi:hypothetical protein
MIVVAIATVVTPVAVAALAFVQWRISEANTQRQRQIEAAREARRRDDELLHWGDAVLTCMSRIETLCEFGPESKESMSPLLLVSEASALVDRGRLFFPNVETDDLVGDDDGRGLRVAILDEVVRAYYLAKFAIAMPHDDLTRFKSKIRGARRRFVKHLQVEMGASLTKSAREKIGVSVSPDPNRW